MMGLFSYVVTLAFQFLSLTGEETGLLTQQPSALKVEGVTFEPHAPQGLYDDNIPLKPLPGFQCHYPRLRGWKSCNGPNSRDCWLRDTYSPQPIFSQFDIRTDYEDRWPPGITREYYIDVSYQTISPDGFPKNGQVFNKTYPGPLIEACWGDDIVVHVTNTLPDNGTTIHWHGIRQLHTNDADGVNGVTQCPIAENNTFTYRFKALQYGPSWYHSHYSLQYPNGVAGPLLIHGPTSADWDIAWDPIFVEDWVHENAFAEFPRELSIANLPTSDSVLLGGQGVFNGKGSTFTRVVPGKKRILIRLVNTSTDMGFAFSVDGHSLKVISTDFVPIEPYVTDFLRIAIGQRYAVVIETDQKIDNYWIRTEPLKGCSGNGTFVDGRTGIFRYQGAQLVNPTTTAHPNINYTCVDEPLTSLKPVVPWEVGRTPANDVLNDTFEVGLQSSRGALRWAIGQVPMWLNFSDPTLISLNNQTFNPDDNVYEFNYVNEWVYLVITGNGSIIGQPTPNRTLVRAAHPIHMHGHDFAILGHGENAYDETKDPLSFTYHNPPRRDVALLPANGWLALAFRSDNPGAWLVHCHIAWHASSGLALQMLERKNEILKVLGPERIGAMQKTCLGWDNWLKGGEKIDQEDSGI